MTSTDGTFLPLRLVEEHLDEIGTLWLQRRGLLMSLSAGRRDVAKVDRRIALHRHALDASAAEAVREAELRLHSPVGWRRFAGARVLLELSPESLRAADGRLRPQGRRNDYALLDALRHGPTWVGGWGDATDPLLLDAASFHLPMPKPALEQAFASGDESLRRASLLAASRHRQTADVGVAMAHEALKRGDPGVRSAALYALGLADPTGFSGRARSALGGDPIAAGADPLVVALFSGPEAAPALVRSVTEAALTEEIVFAFGLTGSLAACPLLVSLLEHESATVRAAALHALHVVTGRRFVRQPGRTSTARSQIRSDECAPDPDSAREHLRSVGMDPRRHHLGLPLDADVDLEALPTSLSFLGAVTRSDGDALRREVPDALLPGEGCGALSMGPDHLFPTGRALGT